jgi:ribosome-binding protein aMBF1 (putative translation factor)
MSDALDRMMDRIRRDNPDAGAEYDRLRERAHAIAPIIAARRAAGWSQRDLAARTGVPQPVIARLECGDNDPKLSTLVRLARALGLQLTYEPLDQRAG